MKRAGLLTFLSIALLLAAARDASAQLPITMETSLDANATFQAFAQLAGMNVVSQGLDSKTAVPFKVQNTTVTETLDLLTKQTNTFWTSWDDKTILVFPDTAQNRKDYDRQFLRKVTVAGSAPRLVQELIGKIPIGAVATSENTIVLRGILSRIDAAETSLGTTSTPFGGPDLANVYLTEAGARFRTPTSVRSQLKNIRVGNASLDVTESVRTTYETLGRETGVHVLFGRNFPTRSHTLHIKDVNYFDALDLLAIGTNTFWQPVNETTIMVYDDTQQNRRDFESQLIETVYLNASVSTQRLNEIMNLVRGLLSLRGIYQNSVANAIVMKDRVANTIVTEAIAEEMSGFPVRKEVAAGILEGFTETGGPYRTPTEVRSALQTRSPGLTFFQITGPVESVYANLATLAGLDLLPQAMSRNVTFGVKDQGILDALDLLALQSATFWAPLGERTIQVYDDTQQNRRDFQPQIAKTIYLPPGTSTNELNMIMNVLRTALSLRGVYQYDPAKAIFIRDTPGRVALAERIVRHLNVRQGDVTSVTLAVPGLTEMATWSTAFVARPLLRTAAARISVNMNQDVKTSYETLGRMARLVITFDARVVPRNPVRFNLNGVDVLDALDYLALQTDTFWKVVDDHTILVAPDTQQAHLELDTRLPKVFHLTNTNSSAVAAIANILRVVLVMRQVSEGPGAIEIVETPQRLALAEQVIVSLDKVLQ